MTDLTLPLKPRGIPLKMVDLGDGTYGVATAIKADTPSNGAPISVTNAAGGVVVAAANTSRVAIVIQNVGLKAVLLRLGGDPATTNYNFVLAADTALRAGNGGSVVISEYNGAVKAICEDAAGSTLAVTEYTV